MTAVDRPPATKPASLLRNRDFGLLWVGAGFSFLGARITVLVYPMLVLWSGGASATAGLAGFVALLPQLLVQLPAGVVVDRWDRRRLMIACELGCMVAVGSLAVAVYLGQLWLPHLFAVAFVEGSLLIFYQLAERSAVPQLVPPERLAAAFSQNEARTRGAGMLGQPTGTGLFALASWAPLGFGVATHLVSVLALLGIRKKFQVERTAAPRAVRTEIAEGLSMLWRRPFVRSTMLIMAATNLLFQALTFSMLPLFRDENRPEFLLGVVLAMSSVGGLLGALTATRWMKVIGLRSILLYGLAVWAVVTPLVSVAHDAVFMCVLFAISGYVGGVFNVPAIVYLMRTTPSSLHGRVGSVANLVGSGAMALGWLGSGLLLEAVSPRQGVFVIGMVMVVVAVGTVLSPSVRGATGPAESKPLA